MRPNFEEINGSTDFLKWYWLKEEMIAICKIFELPTNGGKFEIRDRIAHYLDTGEILKKEVPKNNSKFNWAKESLSEETLITDNVSFGPNFRRFMKKSLGDKFACTSEFMAWVKANSGKTLKDAMNYWEWLESRKSDPSFRREIADHNMYNQYIRDFMDANPQAKLSDAKTAWEKSKQLPTQNGFVKYDANAEL